MRYGAVLASDRWCFFLVVGICGRYLSVFFMARLCERVFGVCVYECVLRCGVVAFVCGWVCCVVCVL
jgi:hypothetical protein